jgi:hypothetical protein
MRWLEPDEVVAGHLAVNMALIIQRQHPRAPILA